jgi:prolipoprotein diacylglyceryltransferase
LAKLRKGDDRAQKAFDRHRLDLQPLLSQARRFGISIDALTALARAREYRSLPVHPAQLYASLDGFLLAALLSMIFYRRKRHGVVFGWLLLLYPVCRIAEEIIRVDNPHDTVGLTISQFISVLILIGGVVWMVAVHRMPLRSPKAVPYVPPPLEPKPAKKPKSKKRR